MKVKSFARLKDEILFVKLNNDGFDLGAQRREIEGSEIPEIIRIVQKYHADLEPQTADDDILHHPLVTIASKERVAEQDYILVGERYKVDMIQQLHVPLPDFMQEELKPLPWEVERNSLIKKECHKYDEEWRMLSNCKMNLPAMIECVPAGVIIGLRTPPVDKNLIISMAKEAGVKNIYQSYIDEKNRLNAYLLKDV